MVVRNSRSLLLACTALFVFGVGVPAHSQSPEEEAASQKTDRVTPLKKIVVGAGQRKVAIDTPQAVTVLDQKDIDDTQAETIGDVFRDVPGVSIAGSERVFGEAFNIRGIGSTEDSADGSRIVVNVDGAQKFYEQYRMGSFFSDPELYKSVEVLRGPASSTLYGAGALGGVINFTTKDASDFLQNGNDNALRVKGSYESNGNGYLGSTIFAHRFNDSAEFLGMINKRGSSEIELGNGTDLSGSDFQSWSGLAKTTFHLGDEQTVRLSYQHWDSDANDQDYAQTGTQSAFGTIDRHVIDDTAVVSYEDPASDNPWLDLKASISYSNTKVDQDNGSLTGFGSNIIDADYGYQTWQANLQNTSEFSGANWVNYLTYGVQLSHQDRSAESELMAPFNPTPGYINTHPEGTDNKVGLFLQNEFVLDERLTLIGGVRGDFVWRQPGDSTDSFSNAVDVSDQAFSPKIAAHYKLTDEWGVFGSIAHTERLPTLDELYTWSKGTSLDLKKEKSNNYEAGIAFSHDDLFQSGDNISVKTTAFYNDLTDLISTRPGTISYYYNVGKARIYGVEVEGAYDSDYAFAKLAYTGTQGQDRSDGVNYNKPLPTVPAHKIAFTLGGRVPDQDIEYGARVTHAFEAQNSVRGTAASSGTTANHTVVPSPDWTTVDVFASWRPQSGEMQGWQVQASIHNIFDQYYRENTALDYSKGRTFKVTLTKQLDW